MRTENKQLWYYIDAILQRGKRIAVWAKKLMAALRLSNSRHPSEAINSPLILRGARQALKHQSCRSCLEVHT